MYKLLMFLKNTDDESVINSFKRSTELLSEIKKENIKIANVEPSLIDDEKYLYFCEFIAESKEKMDEYMSSPEGREFNKIAGTMHRFLKIIFVQIGE